MLVGSILCIRTIVWEFCNSKETDTRGHLQSNCMQLATRARFSCKSTSAFCGSFSLFLLHIQRCGCNMQGLALQARQHIQNLPQA